MKNYKNMTEIIGWYGAGAILLAYALNTFNVLDSGDLMYQLLNLTGAVGIVVISIAKGAKQPAALNVVWAIIALIATGQILISLV